MDVPQRAGSPKPAMTDVKTLREAARRHIEEGAVTEFHSENRETVISC
jgi:bacterioferritin